MGLGKAVERDGKGRDGKGRESSPTQIPGCTLEYGSSAMLFGNKQFGTFLFPKFFVFVFVL